MVAGALHPTAGADERNWQRLLGDERNQEHEADPTYRQLTMEQGLGRNPLIDINPFVLLLPYIARISTIFGFFRIIFDKAGIGHFKDIGPNIFIRNPTFW